MTRLKLLKDSYPQSIWLNGWVFVYKLSGCGFESGCSHLNFRFCTCFEQEFLDIQATIECGFMIRTYSHIRRNILSKYCKAIIRFCINNSLYIVYNKLSLSKKVLLVVESAAHLVQSNKACNIFPSDLITQVLYWVLVQSHERELCFLCFMRLR